MPEVSLIDLHSHSNASDGAFTPEELVAFAKKRGVKVLALTDHDTTGGIERAMAAAGDGLQLVPGIEVSTTWKNFQIHVAALFIDIHAPCIEELMQVQAQKRLERALAIGRLLERQGFENAYERTKAQAGEGASITRGNYSRYIASTGACRTSDEAFNKYLRRGRPAYVATRWGSVEDAVKIILEAGGIPVLAHPRRYEMTNTKLRELIACFKQAGGVALEAASSQQKPNDRIYLADLCVRFELLASVGSDFHALNTWRDPGHNLMLPEGRCTALWEAEQYRHLFTVHTQKSVTAGTN
ncbi:MAG: PHP domain-containing protein [Proteobacteria bacterium]|uniref:PHP domain-containing protein n=1 Tax=Candidatus Avisuccinivibrio stercorigallinarum TaxID=2840704 RepID=A0A9D9GT12_9GAMM|nr:PHP domain-containing protein [Candidatus Avisuccinivibrio stercorigallinarum]